MELRAWAAPGQLGRPRKAIRSQTPALVLLPHNILRARLDYSVWGELCCSMFLRWSWTVHDGPPQIPPGPPRIHEARDAFDTTARILYKPMLASIYPLCCSAIRQSYISSSGLITSHFLLPPNGLCYVLGWKKNLTQTSGWQALSKSKASILTRRALSSKSMSRWKLSLMRTRG